VIRRIPSKQAKSIFGRIAVEINSLRELYIDQLRDLFDAENQLIKALPKMAKAASSDQLREGIEEHWEQTKGHAERLEQLFDGLGEKVKGQKCKGMEGVIKEGSETIAKDMDDDVMDAAIIAAAQRVEYYEIAGYGTARTYASLLGENEAAEVLEQTLTEEKETDHKLTQLAEEINLQAEEAGAEDAEAAGRLVRRQSASGSRRKTGSVVSL